MTYVLYNPLSNNKKGEESKKELETILSEKETDFIDVRTIKDSRSFIEKLNKEDELILCGGDGTLNRFVNEIYDYKLKQKLYLFPSGSGNDFANDVKDMVTKEGKLIPLNKFIENLPVVKVNGLTRRFINGIGFGIDGYCCEVGDELKEKSDKPVNYAGIAIKGLLGKFHPSNATVTVDGKTESFRKVWLAPSMIGKFYGGGMMVAPVQDRFNPEKTLSLVVWHKSGKLSTLAVFPSIFKGQHIKHTKMIRTITGHEITVKFDRPQALQIDGETVKNVTEYSVSYN